VNQVIALWGGIRKSIETRSRAGSHGVIL
jgi:hypothetical protein